LEGNEPTAYLHAIRKSGKKHELKTVDQLSSTEFMAACKNVPLKIANEMPADEGREARHA
jgi:hypothetical protein